METDSLLRHITDAAESFRAVDIKVLKVTDVCDFADYLVIMSGTSTTHVQSIAEEIHIKCKKGGRTALHREGLVGGEWVLLDFGEIITHVFHPEKRAYYNLEELWGAAEALPQ